MLFFVAAVQSVCFYGDIKQLQDAWDN